MKVEQLIKKLKRYDPEWMVVVDGYEGGVEELQECHFVSIALNVNPSMSCCGPHEIETPDKQQGRAYRYALYLPRPKDSR